MNTIKTLTGILLVLGLFALPQTGWAGGGCSLVDGEYETPALLGLSGIFLFAFGALTLAERLRRLKK